MMEILLYPLERLTYQEISKTECETYKDNT